MKAGYFSAAVALAALHAAFAGSLNLQAPFGAFSIRVPEFPARDFPVTGFGAQTGIVCTVAIDAAIQACERAGGGRVVVPPGEWLTGAISLRSGCMLYLAEGATLCFSDDPADYPVVQTTWEGVECMNHSPLIYAYGATNVAISGAGTLAPRMERWRTWCARTPAHMRATEMLYHWGATNAPVAARNLTALSGANVRPHLVQFNRCASVLLEDFRIRESPFWTIHLYHSTDCTVRGIDSNAHGFNTDGVDIDMARNVLVENCRFDQGDDGIVLKSGRNQDAWRLARPTENVVVRNCEFATADSLVAVGSELSGGIRNIHLHDCRIARAHNLLHVKTNRRRGGFVENVTIENVSATNVDNAVLSLKTDVLYQWARFPDYELRRTAIRGISMRNVRVRCADMAFEVLGDAERPVEGLRFDNVRVDSVRKGVSNIVNARDVGFEDVSVGMESPIPWRK